MAQFSRLQVYHQMRETGIMPLFYNDKPDVCYDVMKACYAGGARVFEITNRGDFAHELFGELIKMCKKNLPDLILGTGSVMDGPTAALYLQLGSNFIVAPVLVEEVATICNRRKVPWIPGAGSVTEISNAEALGAELIKIFPATQVGGPEFIKAIKGPMPWTNIMPTGGVKPEENNIKAWFEAGAYCLGMGSQLMVKNKDGGFDLKEIEKLTQMSIQWASKYKKSK